MKLFLGAFALLVTVGLVAGFVAPPESQNVAQLSAVEPPGPLLADASTAAALDGSTAAPLATGAPLSDVLGVVGLLGAAAITAILCLRTDRWSPREREWDTPPVDA